MSSAVCIIPSNPDVSGIGMRIGIYISSYLVALVPNIDHYGINKLRGVLIQAAGLNGLALLITAVIQTGLGNLDLYHATVIIHQLGFLGLSTLTAGEYKDTMQRVFVYWGSSLLISIVFSAWTLFVWIDAPNIGGGNCNNSMIYVIFFVNVRATVPWLRWIFVVLSSFAVVISVTAALVATYLLWSGKEVKFEIPVRRIFFGPIVEDPLDIEASAGARKSPAVELSAPRTIHRQITTKSGVVLETPDLIREMTHSRGASGGVDVGVMWPEYAEAQPSMTNHFSKQSTSTAIRLAVLVYGTVMLELTIHRNHVQSGDNSWGFGQIVAVVIALAGFNEVLHFMLGYEWENATEEDERLHRTVPRETRKFWKELGKRRNGLPQDLKFTESSEKEPEFQDKSGILADLEVKATLTYDPPVPLELPVKRQYYDQTTLSPPSWSYGSSGSATRGARTHEISTSPMPYSDPRTSDLIGHTQEESSVLTSQQMRSPADLVLETRSHSRTHSDGTDLGELVGRRSVSSIHSPNEIHYPDQKPQLEETPPDVNEIFSRMMKQVQADKATSATDVGNLDQLTPSSDNDSRAQRQETASTIRAPIPRRVPKDINALFSPSSNNTHHADTLNHHDESSSSPPIHIPHVDTSPQSTLWQSPNGPDFRASPEPLARSSYSHHGSSDLGPQIEGVSLNDLRDSNPIDDSAADLDSILKRLERQAQAISSPGNSTTPYQRARTPLSGGTSSIQGLSSPHFPFPSTSEMNPANTTDQSSSLLESMLAEFDKKKEDCVGLPPLELRPPPSIHLAPPPSHSRRSSPKPPLSLGEIDWSQSGLDGFTKGDRETQSVAAILSLSAEVARLREANERQHERPVTPLSPGLFLPDIDDFLSPPARIS